MKYNWGKTIHSGDVGSNTSVGCSQRGDPVLQKLSRNSFNRRQLTLVVRSDHAGHTFTFFFATNKTDKTCRWQVIVHRRTCCCCRLRPMGSQLHFHGWKKMMKISDKESFISPQCGGHIYRPTAVFSDQVDNVSQSEGGQDGEDQEPDRPWQGRKSKSIKHQASTNLKRFWNFSFVFVHQYFLPILFQFFISVFIFTSWPAPQSGRRCSLPRCLCLVRTISKCRPSFWDFCNLIDKAKIFACVWREQF